MAGPTVDLGGMRSDIESAVRAEAEGGAFRALVAGELERAGAGDERDAIADEAVRVVTGFVEGAPAVAEATLEAAERAGLGEKVRPIFETAMRYLGEEMDFIPDSVGLAGVLDDAYLIYGLMQEIGERHRELDGTALVPEGVRAVMPDIKRLIGEPTATRLEVAIVAFARSQDVRETIELISRRLGGEGLSLEMPSAAKIPGAESPLARVPDLELGRRWSGG